MPVGLYPREARDALAVSPDETDSAPEQPGFLAGVVGAAATGFEEGAVKGVLARIPEHQAVVGYGLPAEAYKASELTDDEYRQRLAKDTTDVLSNFASDPHTVGTAGQILHGLTSAVTRFVGGTVATGSPVGGAVAVGGSEGVATSRELRAHGVDDNTADALGAGTAFFSGGASLLPGGYGHTLAQRIFTGASANMVTGFSQRGLMHNVLADAGYTEQANQYKALDAQAAMADMVLGAGFGAVHHVFAPSVVDAARGVKDADSVETRVPGTPATPGARDAHVANMNAAAEALLSGEDMPPLRDVEYVPNPAQDALSAARASEVTQAAAEVTGEPIAQPVTLERRSDAVDAARMKALRELPERTPEQQAEYVNLLEKDRLAAKVGGRAIKGLLSREAYEEMAARGEAKPYVAYFDLDMFKDINDQFGMHHGDEAIRATGEAAAAIAGEGNAFKASERAGDEFAIQGRSPVSLERQIDAIRQHLQNHTIEVHDAQGNLVKSRKGLDFSHGIGRSIDAAAEASKLAKAERARLGLRADRGTVPAPARDNAASPGNGEAPAGAETAGEVTKLDPITDEAVTQAQTILAARADTRIPGEGDTSVPAAEALTAAMDELKNAQSDGELTRIAAACFGRG